MKRFARLGVVLVCIAAAFAGTADAQIADGIGIRAGVGTDITGGVVFGAELNYTRGLGLNAVELGVAFFGGSFEEDSEEGNFTYFEETDIVVVAALVNYLFSYSLDKPGPYFVAGAGVGAISVDWEEFSPNDSSIGPPVSGGFLDSDDGTAGGLILNFGIGHRFSPQFDLRAQVPTFFILGAPGDATTVAPAVTVTAGLRF